jgi:O-antigen ligase
MKRLMSIDESKKLRITVISIPLLVLSNLILIMISSNAPFEQQFFGRTGRGLGFITLFALIMLTLSSMVFIKYSSITFLLNGIVFSTFVSSIYAFIQKFELDVFTWNSRTNGIIGTIGNPNFQSSLVAMALIPAAVISFRRRHRYLLTPFIILFFLGSIFIAQSTQGYIGAAIALLVLILTRAWFISKKFFYGTFVLSSTIGVYVMLGSLNIGFFAKYLYKTSVQSRGDFWRSAWNMGIDNPIFGVGLDSFKDYYFLYRDQKAADHVFAETADNAHNYFLEFFATGGFLLAVTYLAFICYTFHCFIHILKKQVSYDPRLAAIFSAWCVIQAQSIISPGNIVILTWNFILSGTAIGFNILKRDSEIDKKINKNNSGTKLTNLIFFMIGLLIVLPLFRSDRVLLNGLNSQNGDLIIESTELFPRSEVRYNLVGLELLKSGLFPQSLEVAKGATKWNPNAVSGWGLIVSNPVAPIEEREIARKKILQLDPFNKIARDLKF